MDPENSAAIGNELGAAQIQQANSHADVVSYDGDQWTANQWNYDEVPGGSSGTWTNDGTR